MKPINFRVGNYLHDGRGRVCRVEEININGFRAPAIVGGLTTMPNQRISLTEAWLIALGFQYRNEREGLLSILDIEGETWKHNLSVSFIVENQLHILNCPTCKELEYVDELQNLYFVLTGIELKVK